MLFNIDYNLSLHKIFFSNVLRDIERRKWKDFDFHRLNFTSSLEMIKGVKWIEVDNKKYDKIFAPEYFNPFSLRSSRYSHRSFDKCFPTSSTCHECYKYFCACCGSGTNCMYGERCLDRRCSVTIDGNYKDLYEIESQPIRVFAYSTSTFDMFDRLSICPREVYGY